MDNNVTSQEPNLSDEVKEPKVEEGKNPLLIETPKKKFQISQQTQIEMQIGWLIGISIGLCGSFVSLVFFTDMSMVFRILTAILFLGLIGQSIQSLVATIHMRKQYIQSQEQIKNMLKDFQVIHKQMNYVG